MRRTWPILLPAILLALAGAYVSYMLLAKHLVNRTGVAWFDQVCEGGEESTRSCDDVLASEHGMFPPVPFDTEAAERYKPRAVLGLFELTPRPVALFGLLYFIALAGWYLAIGRPGYSRQAFHLLPLLLNVLGVCGAGYFAYLMFFTDLEAWCPWCLVTHVINVLLLVCAVLLWPRKPLAVEVPLVAEGAASSANGTGGLPVDETTVIVLGEGADTSPAEDTATTMVATQAAPSRAVEPAVGPVEQPHPSFRLVLVTLAGITGVMAAEWFFHDYVARTQQYAALDREMEAIRQDAAAIYSTYEAGEKHEIPIRPDDPVINPGPGKLVLIIFTDFECPHCAAFEKYLAREIAPPFGDKLKTVFKYFPTNKPCNQRVKDTHPHACRAASAAEAARMLGGNDAFWKAHELLFASGRKLADFDYRALAKQLGLDPDRFLAAMDSEQVQARIKEDIELGFQVGVNATPTLYLSGRRVPKIAVRSQVFWQLVKARLDRILQAHQAQQEQQAPGQQPTSAPAAQTEQSTPAPPPQTQPAPTGGNHAP